MNKLLLSLYLEFSKSLKSYYLKEYFAPVVNNQSQDISQYMFQMGKYKGKKDASKLNTTVQEMKSSSLASEKCVHLQTVLGQSFTNLQG